MTSINEPKRRGLVGVIAGIFTDRIDRTYEMAIDVTRRVRDLREIVSKLEKAVDVHVRRNAKQEERIRALRVDLGRLDRIAKRHERDSKLLKDVSTIVTMQIDATARAAETGEFDTLVQTRSLMQEIVDTIARDKAADVEEDRRRPAARKPCDCEKTDAGR